MAKSDSSVRDNLIQVLREGHYIIAPFILRGLPQLHRSSGDTITAAHDKPSCHRSRSSAPDLAEHAWMAVAIERLAVVHLANVSLW